MAFAVGVVYVKKKKQQPAVPPLAQAIPVAGSQAADTQKGFDLREAAQV
jgi:hypothetical protein